MKLDTGTRVLITGASKGIGASLARVLAARGCVLGLVARDEEGLRELVSGLPGEGHRALTRCRSRRRSSRSSPARRRICPRARAGATSPSTTASG